MALVTNIVVSNNKKKIMDALAELAEFFDAEITMTLTVEGQEDIVEKVSPPT
jgi:hypothetical protein